MGYSLDIEHGHDDSMVMRQLLHGRVQFFLQFMNRNLLRRVSIACCCDEVRVVFDVVVGIVQAGMLSTIALLKEVDRHVDRD